MRLTLWTDKAKSILGADEAIRADTDVLERSVVMKDVPPNSVVVGNPARIIETNIRTGRWGMRHPEMIAAAEAEEARPAAAPARELESSAAG